MDADSLVGLEFGDHVVQFYERGTELTETVAGYLGAALAAGEAAVIVATGEHVAGFEAAIQSTGVDVGRARADGRLVVVDAAEALGRFMHDGWPDVETFEDVIGGLIRSAAATAPAVKVFGEMVAVLWEAGLVGAAVRLEELWNALAQRTPFSLFCAYPAELVGRVEDFGSLVRVCHQHSGIVGEGPGMEQAAARFDCSPLAPREARHFVTETLLGWGRGDLADHAAIVVTELATNAINHAHSGFEARIARRCDRVRVELTDASRAVPVPGAEDTEAPGGRGLRLVAALSTRWGHELLDNGKRVWAELGA